MRVVRCGPTSIGTSRLAPSTITVAVTRTKVSSAGLNTCIAERSSPSATSTVVNNEVDKIGCPVAAAKPVVGASTSNSTASATGSGSTTAGRCSKPAMISGPSNERTTAVNDAMPSSRGAFKSMISPWPGCNTTSKGSTKRSRAAGKISTLALIRRSLGLTITTRAGPAPGVTPGNVQMSAGAGAPVKTLRPSGEPVPSKD